MKLIASNIFGLLKCIASIAMLLSMLLQPIAEGISAFTDAEFELSVLEIEEDQDEEEKKENDNIDEKIEAPASGHNIQGLAYLSESASYEVQALLWDFDREIPIPPPQPQV